MRLGVFGEGIYAERDGVVLVAPEVHAFMRFVCAVGAHMEGIVLFGRAGGPATRASDALPRGPELVPLPYYASLRDLRAVAAALAGTSRAFWRGLDRVDAVWIFGPHPVAFVFVLLALLRRRPVILGVRQDSVEYFRGRLGGGRTWQLAGVRLLDRGFALLSRRLPSTVVGEAIARRYGGPAPVLPFAVTVIREAEVADGADDGRWDGPIELLAVGRIDAEKNPLLVVDLLAELERRHPGRFRLAWAGSGPLETAVRERAVELGVSDRLELLGFVAYGPDLVDRYRRSHLFVHVSLTEGVPGAVLEALAAATPVVATAVGGVPGALEHGSAGLLVPPRDRDALVAAIERVVDEEPLRRRLVERGLAVARRSTLEVESRRVADFLVARRSGA